MSDSRAARILVVDDDSFIRQLASGLLRRAGHTVVQAASAEEALTHLSEGDPDLLLLDVELPGMTGLELLQQVKPGLTCPVILMTGNDSESDKEAGLALGAHDYIVKPFSPADFPARVQAALPAGNA